MENDEINKGKNGLDQGLEDTNLTPVDLDFQEETAKEMIDYDAPVLEDDDKDDIHISNRIYGWVAVGLSILSLFISPFIFGGAAIILGFIARARDHSILGNTAIAIGIISIVGRFIIRMF